MPPRTKEPKTPTAIEQNGKPDTFPLEFQAVELELLHKVLTGIPFSTAFEKQVAASIQMKIEGLVQSAESA
jgi:hypothetical protein